MYNCTYEPKVFDSIQINVFIRAETNMKFRVQIVRMENERISKQFEQTKLC